MFEVGRIGIYLVPVVVEATKLWFYRLGLVRRFLQWRLWAMQEFLGHETWNIAGSIGLARTCQFIGSVPSTKMPCFVHGCVAMVQK
jgi:hypothetical protein